MFQMVTLNRFSESQNGRSGSIFQLADPVNLAFVCVVFICVAYFSVYECLIISGVRLLIAYSTQVSA